MGQGYTAETVRTYFNGKLQELKTEHSLLFKSGTKINQIIDELSKLEPGQLTDEAKKEYYARLSPQKMLILIHLQNQSALKKVLTSNQKRS